MTARRSWDMRILSLLLASLLGCGCSWSFVRKAPKIDPGYRPIPCTESRTYPFTDGVLGLVFVLPAVTTITANLTGSSSAGESDSVATSVVTALLLGLPLSLSALYGFRHTARCRSMNRAPAAPAWVPPSPAPPAAPPSAPAAPPTKERGAPS